ncbi:hypothetical protein THAOC_16361 [Thalassiosira oceanica]|uniref:Uncharacterized protein n=1 Tax=Thalassiosira oceanica TaxID=159749 RepID=K0SCB1_THAOC|nr:hypothetical protein THAOC_16361 [Thalassiosira oceanica]|eukprot:EJK63005.1 hypothetical protein THAOC_16361 [Thalassiosira oceanica]
MMMAMDISRKRPVVEGFKCHETSRRENGLLTVLFHATLPTCHQEAIRLSSLSFDCREPSCGALEDGEEAVLLSDEDYQVDSNFFDNGYSLAGATGFKVWTGTRLLIECLAWPCAGDCSRLRELQQRISHGARVLELGSGVGVLGSYLAAIGSEVLMSDLPTLVENSLKKNIGRNAMTEVNDETFECPQWLSNDDAKRIGRGWAGCASLDWTQPVESQLTKDQYSSIDFIVASDVVFLRSMLQSVFNTVESIFRASTNPPPLILSFQRRDAKDGDESVSFTTVTGILNAMNDRGWSCKNLAWREVTVLKEDGGEDGAVKEDQSEVFVFEINLSNE